MIPSLPQAPSPCAHDWRIVSTRIPRLPKCEYWLGSCPQRHTLAASSSSMSAGMGMRPSGWESARSTAASVTATVSAVTIGPASPGPSWDRQ